MMPSLSREPKRSPLDIVAAETGLELTALEQHGLQSQLTRLQQILDGGNYPRGSEEETRLIGQTCKKLEAALPNRTEEERTKAANAMINALRGPENAQEPNLRHQRAMADLMSMFGARDERELQARLHTYIGDIEPGNEVDLDEFMQNLDPKKTGS